MQLQITKKRKSHVLISSNYCIPRCNITDPSSLQRVWLRDYPNSSKCSSKWQQQYCAIETIWWRKELRGEVLAYNTQYNVACPSAKVCYKKFCKVCVGWAHAWFMHTKTLLVLMQTKLSNPHQCNCVLKQCCIIVFHWLTDDLPSSLHTIVTRVLSWQQREINDKELE